MFQVRIMDVIGFKIKNKIREKNMKGHDKS